MGRLARAKQESRGTTKGKWNGLRVKNWGPGTSLVVQCLRIPASILGQRAKMPRASWPKHQNIQNRSNVITNSIKTLKMVHIKNILKKISKKNWGSDSRADPNSSCPGWPLTVPGPQFPWLYHHFKTLCSWTPPFLTFQFGISMSPFC